MNILTSPKSRWLLDDSRTVVVTERGKYIIRDLGNDTSSLSIGSETKIVSTKQVHEWYAQYIENRRRNG